MPEESMTPDLIGLIATVVTVVSALATAVMTQRNAATKAALDILKEQVKCLQVDGDKKDERIATLERRLAEKDDRIMQLEKRVNELERENANLRFNKKAGGW